MYIHSKIFDIFRRVLLKLRWIHSAFSSNSTLIWTHPISTSFHDANFAVTDNKFATKLTCALSIIRHCFREVPGSDMFIIISLVLQICPRPFFTWHDVPQPCWVAFWSRENTWKPFKSGRSANGSAAETPFRGMGQRLFTLRGIQTSRAGVEDAVYLDNIMIVINVSNRLDVNP